MNQHRDATAAEVYAESAARAASRLSPEHRAHLHASGLTDETSELAGIYTESSHAELAKLLGWDSAAGIVSRGLVIPFEGEGFARVRLDTPAVRKDGSAPKYEQPRGASVRPYFPAGGRRDGRLRDASKRVFYLEGEKKTLLLDQEGYAAIGATGVSCFHDTDRKHKRGQWAEGDGATVLHPSIIERVAIADRDHVIVFDADAATNPEVARAESKLAKMLVAAGADPRRVRVLRLPPDGPKGIDDVFVAWVAERGRERAQSMLRDFLASEGEPVRQKPQKRPVEADALAFENDAARRFVDEHGDRVIYVAGLGWLVWTGTHWARDDREIMREWVKDTASSIRRAAAAATSSDVREELWRLSKSVSTARGVSAVLDLARSDPRVRKVPADLDRHPHLLTCESGTIDLRDGSLREYNPADLITRCAPTAYVRGASHAGFDQVLEHLFPLHEVRAYTQLAAGYSVTGETREDVSFLLIGAPRCGKSTLITALCETLGEHAIEVPMRAWTVDRRGGNPARSDLFRTFGRRVLFSSEIHPGMAEFDLGLFKGLSGGGTLTVREEYGKSVEFKPGFTIWLVANDGDLPNMRAEDDAFWERIRRIPVGSTVPEGQRDPGLRASMASPEARRAVLAWAVEGAVRWYAQGLGMQPEAVRQASGELRDENDAIGPFIRERLVFEDGANVTNGEIKDALDAWFEGERPPSAKRIKAAIVAAAALAAVDASPGSVRRDGKIKQGWRGVRLLTEADAECRGVEGCRGQSQQSPHVSLHGGVSANQALQASTPLHPQEGEPTSPPPQPERWIGAKARELESKGSSAEFARATARSMYASRWPDAERQSA